jgi:hypothetical protein
MLMLGTAALPLVLTILPASTAMAGTLTAELSRTEIAIDEAAELHVTVEGDLDGEVNLPAIDGLLFDQVGRSNQMSFSGGSFTHTLSLVYVVRPQKTGTFQIPSISAQVDDKKESALPLTLTVTGAGTGNQAQNQQGGAQGQRGQQGQQGQPGADSDDSQAVKQTAGVFLERECEKNDPFVGEQVVCSLRIYHRNNLLGGQRQAESGTDFRRFAVEGEKKYVRNLNGKSYGVIELREVVVPLKEGKLTLAPAGLTARIALPSRRGRAMDRLLDQMRGGLFNMDPFNDEREVSLQSNSIEMNVRPLPDAGRPASFSGIVGEVSVAAELSQDKVKAGENITITINVAGHAVLDTLADPPLNFPDIGKVYNDKPEYKETKNPETGIDSSKTFKIALVPTKAGTHNLGSWQLSYFDPKAQAWRTLEAPLGTIIVEPSAAEEQLPAAVAAAEQGPQSVKLLGQDMIGPHRQVNPVWNHAISDRDFLVFLAGGAVPLSASLLFAGFSLALGWRKDDIAGERSSKAMRIAAKSVSRLRDSLKSGPTAVTPAAVVSVLRTYVGDKASRQGGALTSGEILDLVGRHAPGLDLSACRHLLQTAERLEYGGSSADGTALSDLLDGTEGFIRQLEKQWRAS